MKALILNSGIGSRMGEATKKQPKCMTKLNEKETILSRQLDLLAGNGIRDIVMTTGPFEQELIEYCENLNLDLDYTFVANPIYKETNYIYSINLARDKVHDDILLMHGDLVFSKEVLRLVLGCNHSCMTVSSVLELPKKDFKAVIKESENDIRRIDKIGIDFFENAMAAQPLYKLFYADWKIWMDQIGVFCEAGNTSCYAEAAFNQISSKCRLTPLDIKDCLCNEVDTLEDLERIRRRL